MACTNKLKAIPIFVRFQGKYLRNAIAFCTKPQERFTSFRTTENDPTLHTKDHVGKFYVIPPEIKNKLYFSGGIPKTLEIQLKTFRETAIMIREPAIEIISYLKKINFAHPAVRFVLYGRTGVGKSLTLVHILHYAYTQKFLLVHVPWVSAWTNRPKEAVVSQYNEKRVDSPEDSVIWLQHFKMQNAELMTELDLRASKSYTWSLREVTEEGAPVMDIVEHGIQRVRHSSDCVAALLKEIKHHSQFGKFKAMVVIDGVNAFFSTTVVKRPDKTMVSPNEITIMRAFMKLLQNDWKNAVVVSTVDRLLKNRRADVRYPYTPYFLLGQEGFEVLDPFIPIHVDKYTDKEFNSTLDYFNDRNWIQSERARSEEGRRQLKFLSGHMPYELMYLCAPL